MNKVRPELTNGIYSYAREGFGEGNNLLSIICVINLGIIISLAGNLLGWTILAADCPYSAAKMGVFTKLFAKENKNISSTFSLFVTNGIVQLFLIIIYFNKSTYQVFYKISASMIMIPYF